ncbi:hypothetical protein D6779_04440 [Candidatus Parcubacteria bacterium]|nr:MAG: hypothetical protein D6779_04440 [Candidatus Parcubacteria bacterium]
MWWSGAAALAAALLLWAAVRLARMAAPFTARTVVLMVRGFVAAGRFVAARRKKNKAAAKAAKASSTPAWDGACYYEIRGSVLLPRDIEVPAYIRREQKRAA